jgi:hypothetical protein
MMDLVPGAPVVLYLHTPREKIWGILISLQTAGLVLRGLELAVFEDWIRQLARADDDALGAVTAFYPMSRVERLELDETAGPILSCADRFERQVGRSVWDVLGLDRPPSTSAPGAR